MQKTLFIFLSSLFLISLISCDKIEEGKYIKEGKTIWNGRKIIIYDFTGHKCGNCPRAHEAISELSKLYDKALIPIAIHTTGFARTTTTDTSKPFHYNFRTDIGDFLGGTALEPVGYYGELALPMGLVNNLSADKLSPPSNWGTTIAKYISSYPEFNLKIKHNYNQTDSCINSEVEILTNIPNQRKLNLVGFIIEDHIIKAQTDYSLSNSTVLNYEHNHVLRSGINGAFGEEIKTDNNSSNIGDVIIRKHKTKTKADWKITNCSIVYFIFDNETKEVLQAETQLIN